MKSYFSAQVFIFISFATLFCATHKGDSIEENNEEEIPLTEDLMREHGILNRILLIYEEIIQRLEHNEFPQTALFQSVTIIQEFIENYHEKLEEDYLFPLFEKKKKERILIKTLRKQHIRGRTITAQLKKILNAHDQIFDKNTKKMIIALLKKFITMYRPHEAREDTVLFPKVRSLISKEEFKIIGDTFEDREHELFGKEGFFSIVKKVEIIERDLGIYNLEQFTP
jgi:hemerythrin-like domain-containing protein